MDYAKLAYLKAEELESRLLKSPDKNRITRTSVQPMAYALANSPVRLTAINGSGSAAVLVNLQISGTDGSRVHLLLDGKKALSEDYGKTVSFMASTILDGPAEISVSSTAPFTVIKAEIMLIGDASFAATASATSAAVSGGVLGLTEVREGEVRLHLYRNFTDPVWDGYTIAGFGVAADICPCNYAGQSAFAVCFCDRTGNAFLSVMAPADKGCRMLASRFLTAGAQTVSLSRKEESGGENLIFAYCSAGEAYAGALDRINLRLTGTVPVGAADSVALIKGSEPPVAMVSRNSVSVLKLAERELPSAEIIKLDLAIGISLIS